MPFASRKRHEWWTADVRYLDAVDEHLVGGRAYAVAILENHSRAVLASGVFRTQDLSSFSPSCTRRSNATARPRGW